MSQTKKFHNKNTADLKKQQHHEGEENMKKQKKEISRRQDIKYKDDDHDMPLGAEASDFSKSETISFSDTWCDSTDTKADSSAAYFSNRPKENFKKSAKKSFLKDEAYFWGSFNATRSAKAPLPTVNVWEERTKRAEIIEAMQPQNESDEEAMIQQAIELSRLQAFEDENRRKSALEEQERQLQHLLSESADYSRNISDCPKVEPVETMLSDEKDILLKERSSKVSTPLSFEEEEAVRYGGAKPKFKKIADRFGGWGTSLNSSNPKVENDSTSSDMCSKMSISSRKARRDLLDDNAGNQFSKTNLKFNCVYLNEAGKLCNRIEADNCCDEEIGNASKVSHDDKLGSKSQLVSETGKEDSPVIGELNFKDDSQNKNDGYKQTFQREKQSKWEEIKSNDHKKPYFLNEIQNTQLDKTKEVSAFQDDVSTFHDQSCSQFDDSNACKNSIYYGNISHDTSTPSIKTSFNSSDLSKPSLKCDKSRMFIPESISASLKHLSVQEHESTVANQELKSNKCLSEAETSDCNYTKLLDQSKEGTANNDSLTVQFPTSGNTNNQIYYSDNNTCSSYATSPASTLDSNKNCGFPDSAVNSIQENQLLDSSTSHVNSQYPTNTIPTGPINPNIMASLGLPLNVAMTNPLLMQQMMILSNPFFAQQLHTLQMYFGMAPLIPCPLTMPVAPVNESPSQCSVLPPPVPASESNGYVSPPIPKNDMPYTQQPASTCSFPPGIDVSSYRLPISISESSAEIENNSLLELLDEEINSVSNQSDISAQAPHTLHAMNDIKKQQKVVFEQNSHDFPSKSRMPDIKKSLNSNCSSLNTHLSFTKSRTDGPFDNQCRASNYCDNNQSTIIKGAYKNVYEAPQGSLTKQKCPVSVHDDFNAKNSLKKWSTSEVPISSFSKEPLSKDLNSSGNKNSTVCAENEWGELDNGSSQNWNEDIDGWGSYDKSTESSFRSNSNKLSSSKKIWQ